MSLKEKVLTKLFNGEDAPAEKELTYNKDDFSELNSVQDVVLLSNSTHKDEMVLTSETVCCNKNNSTANYCLLCLDAAPDMLDRKLYCKMRDTSDGCSCCLQCLKGYLTATISGVVEGASVPALYCPVCPPAKEKGEGNRCLLNFSFLLNLSESDSDVKNCLNRYFKLAQNVGTIQCGSCHCRKSIQVAPDDMGGIKKLEQLEAVDVITVHNVIKQYDSGDIGVELFFDQVSKVLFPSLNLLSDMDAWNSIILNVLKIIVNPERRINFHLRYLRNRPRVWSPCHNQEQCFKCKTRSYHAGRTCADVCGNYDNEVLSCPQCGIYVVKGDGCDSITCVCGKYFSYNALVKAQRNAKKFAETYPIDTAWMCARVLCRSDDNCVPDARICTPANNASANAWSKEHPTEVEKALLQWWIRKYPTFTIQQSIAELDVDSPPAIGRARNLYRTLHAKTVTQAEAQIQFAKESLWDTFYPSKMDKERLLRSAVTGDGVGDTYMSNINLPHDAYTTMIKKISSSERNKIKREYLEVRCHQFLIVFGQLPLRLHVHATKGISVNQSLTPAKINSSFEVGDEIEVASLTPNLNARKGTVLSSSNIGSSVYFDVELHTAIKIVLYKIPAHRIHKTGVRQSRIVPSLAMSSEQVDTFISFVKFIEAYASFDHESDMGNLRKFVDILMGKEGLFQEGIDEDHDNYFAEMARNYTWSILYNSLQPFLLQSASSSINGK